MRNAWRWCLIAGVIAFVCSWLFGRIPGLIACGSTPGGLSPIIGFEFAQTPSDIAIEFGQEPCRSSFAAAQVKGLLLDAFGFIPSYSAFLMCAALAVTPGKSANVATIRWLLIALLLVAGLADEIEGMVMYTILGNLPGTQAQLDLLWWPVHIKFFALGLGTTAIGAVLVTHRRPLAILFGLFVAATGLWALASLSGMPNQSMMTGFTLAWVAILFAALIGSFSPSAFWVARAAPPPGPDTPSA